MGLVLQDREYLMKKWRHVNIRIIPRRMIYKRRIEPIRITNSNFILKGLTIYTFNNWIKEVTVHGLHPNASPSGIYCLPQALQREYSEKVENAIIELVKIYNLDDCYFTPWQAIERGVNSGF